MGMNLLNTLYSVDSRQQAANLFTQLLPRQGIHQISGGRTQDLHPGIEYNQGHQCSGQGIHPGEPHTTKKNADRSRQGRKDIVAVILSQSLYRNIPGLFSYFPCPQGQPEFEPRHGKRYPKGELRRS